MRDYYFLVSLLPPLEIGHTPGLGFAELKELLSINLSHRDERYVGTFLQLIDLENLRAYWADEPLDPRGNLTKKELEQSLLYEQWSPEEEFPFYLRDYLNNYNTDKDRLKNFYKLLGNFLSYHIEKSFGFVKNFFEFQRNIHLIMVGFRAKLSNRDVVKELAHEDPSDVIVQQILSQKDSKTYEPPFEYKELKPIFEENKYSPIDLHRELYVYQFNYMVELWGGEFFTIDRVLNYMARLILCERWLELDTQAGVKIIDDIETGVR